MTDWRALTLIVPFRSDLRHRARAWEWCEQRYRALLPGAEIIVQGDGSSGGPFNKAWAVNRAAAESTRPYLLLGDADSALPVGWAERAFDLVQEGRWALTSSCHYLTEAQTAVLLEQDPAGEIKPPTACDYSGTVSWGGHVLLSRAAFDLVNGMDERFCGWGPEDSSFGLALETLYGYHDRVPGALIHLWHPAPYDATWGAGWREWVRVLHDRYLAAVGDPKAMAELVEGNRLS